MMQALSAAQHHAEKLLFTMRTWTHFYRKTFALQDMEANCVALKLTVLEASKLFPYRVSGGLIAVPVDVFMTTPDRPVYEIALLSHTGDLVKDYPGMGDGYDRFHSMAEVLDCLASFKADGAYENSYEDADSGEESDGHACGNQSYFG